MRSIRLLACAASTLAVVAATPAFAQSTGSRDFDNTIVVSAHKGNPGVGGVAVPDTAKAKATLTKEWIQHQIGGQAVNELVNYLPGVTYTNNDPYGGTSGNFYIRGFDNSRISETFDGVTLNDDGGYALYGGEMLDSELIDSVTVSLGGTDVDSPTSSATGPTVNYVSIAPTDAPGGKVSGGYGTDNYYRIFGLLQTGEFGPFGTKGWISASKTMNNSPYDNYGKIRKWEANGKLYQPINDGHGDFFQIAAFYVEERNNFSGSDLLTNKPLAADTGLGFEVFPTSYANSVYHYPGCTTAAGVAGTADKASTCGTAYEYRPNPDNLFNLRGAFKYTIADGLVFTADPSYQFTKANGGGTVTATEGYDPNATDAGTDKTATGYIYNFASKTSNYYLGKDLNGDGDTLDKVTMYAPSETKTHRVALESSLRYDILPTQSVRIAYAFARSVITQSGEMGYLNADGSPVDVYATDAAVTDANGYLIQKRDTRSVAELNQISGEYRGQFLDKRLTVTAGVRAPFLHRALDNHCFTTSISGGVSCTFGTSAAAYAAANPYTFTPAVGTTSFSEKGAALPQIRKYNYSAVLPNVGATFKIPGRGEVFFNYSVGFQAPYTTALYNTFYVPQGTAGVEPVPEKSENFDLGYRYNEARLSGQVDLWYTHYTNKLGSSYDAISQLSTYTNLGPVQRYGIDANVSYKITPHVLAYGFVSWLHSKIETNTDAGPCAKVSAIALGAGQTGCIGTEGYLLTASKSESAMPHFMIGGRLQGDVGPLTLGVQAKHTAERFLNDENVALVSSGNKLVADGTQVWGQRYPQYTTVDLDVRYSLKSLVNDRSFMQLNVTNLFNAFYVGSVSSNTSALQTGGTNVQVSPPRAVVGTLTIGY